MLHEILLSLSGHPSPLLRQHSAEAHALAGITPPERQLLASAAHLSDVHIKLITSTAQVAATHPSAICRAAAAAIDSIHLAAFQRKVLEVEEGILRDDPALVGAYNIVPLTAVMGEFKQWTRRMDWMWRLVQFISPEEGDETVACWGSRLMDKLREDLQSGYDDVRQTALSLVTVAETAWLKQVSAWVLYGKLPTFGQDDFFIQRSDGDSDEEFICDSRLLPSFVTPAAASSMLFIGKSLNHVRVKSTMDVGLRGYDQMSSQLQLLSNLKLPLDSANFARTVKSLRMSLAEHTLQRILPLEKILEMLQLMRDFFLLGRGEFAMALTQEADEKIRNRWRRADNMAYDKGDALKNVTVKDGEVAAVLGRTWAVLASLQSHHADEDEQLELARGLLRLQLSTPKSHTPAGVKAAFDKGTMAALVNSPFRNLLFSVPSVLAIQIPSPLDMVFSPSDLQLYSSINAYLLSMRRAHLRLTDLWKITSLRRQHPAIRGANEHAVMLRERWDARTSVMRGSWTTASAAVFFLGETEAYLQTEVVAGLWEGFHAWLTGSDEREQELVNAGGPTKTGDPKGRQPTSSSDDEDDLWLQDEVSGRSKSASREKEGGASPRPAHDPQALSTAHSVYLHTMVQRLLLTQPAFTEPLYALLVHIDHLVSHIRRLHSIFTSIDLETDAGVVDAFVDLEREESEVRAMLHSVEGKVRKGIEDVVSALRTLEGDAEFMATWEGEGVAGADGDDLSDGVGYVPARVGGINRLLMKLDFGSWFGPSSEWQGY